MEIKFNVTKDGRKTLVAAVGEILGVETKYLGAPGFAYATGDYTIDRTGTIIGGEYVDAAAFRDLLCQLVERGFVAASAEDGDLIQDVADVATIQEVAATDFGTEEPDKLIIELPLEGFSGETLGNVRKLVAGKASLIRKAIGSGLAPGAENLPIEETASTLCFPWFRMDMEYEQIAAWSHFIGALSAVAKKQKRVITKEKELEEGASEKFAMRCFLLKLGFIGDEYKEARKVILSELPGNGSHKTGDGKRRGDQDAERPEAMATTDDVAEFS